MLYFLLQEDLGLPESTYELCYNAACALIGQGQLTEALNKLRQAEGQSPLICLPCQVAILPLLNLTLTECFLSQNFAESHWQMIL